MSRLDSSSPDSSSLVSSSLVSSSLWVIHLSNLFLFSYVPCFILTQLLTSSFLPTLHHIDKGIDDRGAWLTLISTRTIFNRFSRFFCGGNRITALRMTDSITAPMSVGHSPPILLGTVAESCRCSSSVLGRQPRSLLLHISHSLHLAPNYPLVRILRRN